MERRTLHTSFNQRRNIFIQQFKKSWLIVVFGVMLLIAGIFVLLNNERQTARKIVSLDEALSNVRTIKADEQAGKELNGQLLYVAERLITGEPLTEPDYNIQVQAVKLKRRVQMYQWIEEETETTFGSSVDVAFTDQKTYYYSMDWRDKIVDSSLFYIRSGHENPKEFPIRNRVLIANHVMIGTFKLSDDVKNEINNYIEITSDTRPEDSSIKLHSGLYYHCLDVFNPEVGDIRLQFLTAGIEGTFFTIVAKYENDMFVPYVTSIGTNVLILLPGRHTLDEAFDAAHYERKLHAWALRFISWVLIFFSVTCTTELLTVAFGDIRLFAILLPNPEQPLYGNILLSMSLAIILTALCWIVFRPLLAFGLLFAAVSPFIFCARSIINSYHHIDID